MNQFIGVDVGSERLDISWLREPTSNKKKSKVYKNTRADHQKLCSWVLKNTNTSPENITIVVEPSGIYHEGLIHFLHEQQFKILMVNPGKAKKYADAINLVHKTDKSDAFMLAKYGYDQENSLNYWQPEAVEVRELKVMMRRLDALEKDLQRELNRKGASEFSLVSLRVSKSLTEMIDALKNEIKKLQVDIDDHIDQHPALKKNRALLETIKGIGPVMSRELTLLFATKSFKSAKQAAAFLGLIPKMKESGKMKGKTMLTKQGSPRIRAKLYMAAVCASTFNKDIKDQRARLLKAGKCKMQALGAAMRKLVQICYGVIKHQTEYQPQVVEITS